MAFAALAGESPLQTSLGNNVRLRLNRQENRHLNNALDVFTKALMRCREETIEYVQRWTQGG